MLHSCSCEFFFGGRFVRDYSPEPCGLDLWHLPPAVLHSCSCEFFFGGKFVAGYGADILMGADISMIANISKGTVIPVTADILGTVIPMSAIIPAAA